jgi:uncharacterized protein YbjT (DUF2867 family)
MYVVTGATGQVGSNVVEYLLEKKEKVRILARSAQKGESFVKRGAELVVGDVKDKDSLAVAFKGAEVVFLINPPNYTTQDMMKETEEVFDAYIEVLKRSDVKRIVVLSSVGSQHEHGTGNIKSAWIIENKVKSSLDIPVAFIRAANFIDNWKPQKAHIDEGVIKSFNQPLDFKIPQVSSIDIGRVSAKTMLDKPWTGVRIIELYGPEEYSPNDVAAAFGKVFNKEIKAEAVPESMWKGFFIGKLGCSPSVADNWVEMLQGFNNKHIVFEEGPKVEKVRGQVSLVEAISKF